MEGKVEHLGLIIDGNRRYAKAAGVSTEEAYKIGAKKVYEVIRFVFDKTGISELSIYALSHDNLLRDDKELEPILQIQKHSFDEWLNDSFFKEKEINVRFIGEMDILPKEVRRSCTRLQEKTSGNKRRTLNILIAYIGHREVNSAVRRMLAESRALDLKDEKLVEQFIEEGLQVTKPVDLIIRTAGENRLSGFLPLQSEYAELYPIAKMWPEITTGEISLIIQDFKEKNRKHGL